MKKKNTSLKYNGMRENDYVVITNDNIIFYYSFNEVKAKLAKGDIIEGLTLEPDGTITASSSCLVALNTSEKIQDFKRQLQIFTWGAGISSDDNPVLDFSDDIINNFVKNLGLPKCKDGYFKEIIDPSTGFRYLKCSLMFKTEEGKTYILEINICDMDGNCVVSVNYGLIDDTTFELDALQYANRISGVCTYIRYTVAEDMKNHKVIIRSVEDVLKRELGFDKKLDNVKYEEKSKSNQSQLGE